MVSVMEQDRAVLDSSIATLLTRQAIQDLVQNTAALLDQENLDEWLALFAEESEYKLTAYSSELRKPMTWWKSTRKELEKLLMEVQQHVRDPARRFHLVSPSRVELNGKRAQVTSSFAIFRTLPSGETKFYAVGRYEDQVIQSDERWLYTSHLVYAETRSLDALTHLPL